MLFLGKSLAHHIKLLFLADMVKPKKLTHFFANLANNLLRNYQRSKSFVDQELKINLAWLQKNQAFCKNILRR